MRNWQKHSACASTSSESRSAILLTECEHNTLLCQENELCIWRVEEVAAYDETEEMRIEDEPELLGKVAHKGDVTDLLVSCTYTQHTRSSYVCNGSFCE